MWTPEVIHGYAKINDFSPVIYDLYNTALYNKISLASVKQLRQLAMSSVREVGQAMRYTSNIYI